jgi:predicted  nucleic acid-binding Zn-ribbon protein
MQEYHKQVLIALFMDTKKRIKELEKLLASGEKSDLADAFQYELDLARKSNENLREKINTFDERYKNK